MPEALGLHVTAQMMPQRMKRPPAMIPSAYINVNGALCFINTIVPNIIATRPEKK